MPTEEERRLSNRARQKRFYQRHPERSRDRAKKKRLHKRIFNPFPSHTLATYRLFELIDPRDGDRLPKIVGHCKVPDGPVWTALWSVRNESRSRWAEWLRELDALHLKPQEVAERSLGKYVPLNLAFVKKLVDTRVRQINSWTTGSELIAPPWLLRIWRPFRYPTQKRLRSRRPIGRMHRDGRVEHYPSVKAAGAATALDPPHIEQLVRSIVTRREWTWFDD